jgi:3D (Asp-Asp-Asp) domain-containing protein
MERHRSAALSKAALVVLCAAALHACAPTRQPQVASVPPPPPPAPSPAMQTFEATAYSIEGETASGKQAREGICAADPKVLPLGSRIRVHDAGPYSGECEIADTGRTIDGREIDIYVPNDREAKRFGRKQVRVEVLSRAD